MKFIRKHINEGYFKNPEQARAVRAKEKNMTSAEEVHNVFKQNIQAIASSKCDNFIKSLLVSNNVFNQRAIFSTSLNGAEVKKINYRYSSDNTLNCECVISIYKNGKQFNDGSAALFLFFPECLQDIESMLAKEFECPVKVKIQLVEKEIENAGFSKCILFTPPRFLRETRELRLRISKTPDFTAFCHLLNNIEGIDWSYYILYLDTTADLPKKLYSSEELITKFGYIIMDEYPCDEMINAKMFLSNKVCHESFSYNSEKAIMPVHSNRTPEGEMKFTGVIEIKAKETCEDSSDIVHIAKKCAHIAKEFYSDYSNVFFNVTLKRSSKKYNDDTPITWEFAHHISRSYPCSNLSLLLNYPIHITSNIKLRLYNILYATVPTHLDI